MSRRFDNAADGWAALTNGKHPFSTGESGDSEREVGHKPNKYETHNHESYAKIHKKDLNDVGCHLEFSGKGLEKFWPAEKLVDIGHGKKAPRVMSKRECKEFLHRHACERGWTYTEA